jgi:hypothetical protein
MKSILKIMFIMSALLLFVPGYSGATPVPPRDHPAYLHALTDLRHARAHLQRPDGGELREQEKKAIHEIDEAIKEIKKASIDDGKDLDDHPPVDVKLDWRGRLHRACNSGLWSTSIRPTITSRKQSVSFSRFSS